MKKRLLVLLLFVCLFMAGCNNQFAEREYDSIGKIVKQEDHYAKKNSVYNPIVGGCQLTVGEFDGRETLWSVKAEEEQEMEVSVYTSLLEGQAKIVYVDADGTFTTLLENTSETTTEMEETKKVLLKRGSNRLKVVGYDCKDLEVKLLFEEIK